MTDKHKDQMTLGLNAGSSVDGSDKGVVCLGLKFPNDAARREHYLKLLAEKLTDPEFRKTPGFPNGTDENILEMSDPPYYTACPNPFATEFLRFHQRTHSSDGERRIEPFAADVSEGRNDVVYSAHTYHTKVPPRAIAQYVLHYTEPGDVVLDAFAGSGMTGVGCMLCEDRTVPAPPGARHGHRIPVLVDLSPAATFIGSVYTCPPDPTSFSTASARLLARFDADLGALWTVNHNGAQAQVNFQIWAEVFTCPSCREPIQSLKVVAATDDIGSAKEFACPHCDAIVSKAPTKASGALKLERGLRTRYDAGLSSSGPYLPRAPLFAEIECRGARSRHDTSPQEREALESATFGSDDWFPAVELIRGERYDWKDCLPTYGITHVHQFYLPRQLKTYSHLWALASSASTYSERQALRFFLSSNALGMTVMNRWGPTHYSQVSRYFSGTLYIPSTIAEASPRYTYSHKRTRLIKAFAGLATYGQRPRLVSTQSATALRQFPDETIDYVFVDPPFGRNLQYSELNQIWEAWLRVQTNRESEAVIDSTRGVGTFEYTVLMQRAFAEMYRVLKPGKWMSVVFHNSSNAVWLAIQEALSAAGFIVADVRTLDKQNQTYKQFRQGVVKTDLVISAYKLSTKVLHELGIALGTEAGVWAFVTSHLRQLPIGEVVGEEMPVLPERQDYMLFDRMVAFHVQRSVSFPISASEFYAGLETRFPCRDGMYFLPGQVAEYDKRRAIAKTVGQMELLVRDETSAIQWIRQQLREKPQTFQELQPAFMRAGSWSKYERPLELLDLLEQNFLCYNRAEDVPSQIHAYLSSNMKDSRNLDKSDPSLRAKAADRWFVPDPKKATDMEKLREKSLLKEFDEYRSVVGKRLKVFRLEAVRAGFKRAWEQKDYRTIIDVAKRIPEDVLQEDQKLVMWYDNALTRAGGD
jgi:hypothetical protein